MGSGGQVHEWGRRSRRQGVKREEGPRCPEREGGESSWSDQARRGFQSLGALLVSYLVEGEG